MKKPAHQYLIQPINIYFVLFYLSILRLEYGGNDVYRKNPKYFGKSHSASYIEVKTPVHVGCIPTYYFSEKNLSRPPFRFIHDIVTQLIKKTGFFKDLFPSEMLDSKNVTEKDQKVKFLQAIIACTTLVYGKEITVKGRRSQYLRFSWYF